MTVARTVDLIEQTAVDRGVLLTLSPAHEREVMRRIEDGFSPEDIHAEVVRNWPAGTPSGGLIMHRLKNLTAAAPRAPRATPIPPSFHELELSLADAVPPTLDYLEAKAKLRRSA